MIFIDTRFEELADKNASFSDNKYKFVKIHESCMAGAIISSKKYPPSSEELVKRHIEDGSVFVAFVDKYTGNEGTVRNLLEIGAKNIIRVYLGTPVRKDGLVIIDDFLRMEERDFLKEKAHLISCGVGSFECPVYLLNVILEEIDGLLESEQPVSFYPPYVNYKIIDDWRNMIASMPLIGQERADALYRKYNGRSVIDVLVDLTDPDKNRSGFGLIVCDRLREWIGIPDGFNLGLVWTGEDE